MPANRVKLNVAGSSYVVLTNDSEEYVQSLAERLDQDIAAIMAESATASVTSSAILVALDYLDELEKNNAGADNMRAQIKDYLEDAARAKMAAEDARREVERLRGELQQLKEERG